MKRICTKEILTAALVLLTWAGGTQPSWAQIRAGSAYLKILPGTRQQTLGSGLTGALDEAFSLYANPGATGQMREWHLSGSYNKWIADIYNISLIAGRQLRVGLPWGDRVNAAVGVSYQGFGDFDATGVSTAAVSAQDLLLTASFGFPLSEISRNLSLGFNAKYLRTELAQFSASALVFDTGLIYRTPRFRFPFLFEQGIFSIGGAITQLGNSLTFANAGTPLPRTFRIGAGLNVGAHDELQLQIVGDYRKVRDEVGRFSLGAEVMNFLSPLSRSLGRVVSLRGGYVFNSARETRFLSKYSFSLSFRLDDYMNPGRHARAAAVVPPSTALRSDLGGLGSSQFSNVIQISSDLSPIGPEAFDFIESDYQSRDVALAATQRFRLCSTIDLQWQATRDPDLYDDVDYLLIVGRDDSLLSQVLLNAKRAGVPQSLLRAREPADLQADLGEVRLIDFSRASGGKQKEFELSAGDVVARAMVARQDEVVNYTYLDSDTPAWLYETGAYFWTVIAYDRNGHLQVIARPGQEISRFDVELDPTLQLTLTETTRTGDDYVSNVIISNTGQTTLADSVLLQVAGIDSTALVFEMPERLAGMGIDIDRSQRGVLSSAPVDSVLETRIAGLAAGQSRTIRLRWQRDYPFLLATIDPETRLLCEPVRDTLALYDVKIEARTEVPPLRPGVRFAFNRHTLSYLEPGSRERLDVIRAALLAEEFENAFVKLEGHTDQTGFRWNNHLPPAERLAADKRDNLNLSKKRIATVGGYLGAPVENHGGSIAPDRICAVGFGQEKPRPRSEMPGSILTAVAQGLLSKLKFKALADSMDRRVEISLLKQPVPCDESAVDAESVIKTVMLGNQFKYRFMVTNDGPNDAREVRVWQKLPEHLSVVAVDSLDHFEAKRDSLHWLIANLAAGDTANISLTVRVNSLPGGAIVNEIETSAGVVAPFDLEPANNRVQSGDVFAIGGRIDEIPISRNGHEPPGALDTNAEIQHVVRAGESLSHIASIFSRRLGYTISWRDVYHRNARTIGRYPNAIAIGMKLAIPAKGEVCSASNHAAEARNVRIDGTPKAGATLIGRYTYHDGEGDPEGDTRFRWLRGGRPIAGARSQNYKLVSADLNATLTFEVTPAAQVTDCPVGAARQASLRINPFPAVSSAGTIPSPVGAPSSNGRDGRHEDRPPEARRLNVDGDCAVGQILQAQYDYFDGDGDDEGLSSYRWLRNDNQIPGASERHYRIQYDDVGQSLRFEVTPIDRLGRKGVASQSAHFRIPKRRLPGQSCGG